MSNNDKSLRCLLCVHHFIIYIMLHFEELLSLIFMSIKYRKHNRIFFFILSLISIRHKGPMYAVDWAVVPLTGSHSLKCGNAVLSFPVCNCFKRRSVRSRGALDYLVVLGRAKTGWYLFSVRKYDLNGLLALSLGSINTAAFLGCHRSSCMPTVPSCRKERWSHTYTRSLPQESPSMHAEELTRPVRRRAFDGTRGRRFTMKLIHLLALCGPPWFERGENWNDGEVTVAFLYSRSE